MPYKDPKSPEAMAMKRIRDARYRANHGAGRVRGRFPVLTIEQRAAITSRFQAGESRAELAAEYGVGPSCIRNIAKGRPYKKLNPLDQVLS